MCEIQYISNNLERIQYAVSRLRGDAPVPSSMLFPDSGFKIADPPLLEFAHFQIKLIERTYFGNLPIPELGKFQIHLVEGFAKSVEGVLVPVELHPRVQLQQLMLQPEQHICIYEVIKMHTCHMIHCQPNGKNMSRTGQNMRHD